MGFFSLEISKSNLGKLQEQGIVIRALCLDFGQIWSNESNFTLIQFTLDQGRIIRDPVGSSMIQKYKNKFLKKTLHKVGLLHLDKILKHLSICCQCHKSYLNWKNAIYRVNLTITLV